MSNPSEIAQKAKVTPRYVRDILKLIHLSPRVVEMILDGRQPLDLTVDGLIAGLPLDWRQQDQLFGLAA
jgi:site-specific DNA recombinase